MPATPDPPDPRRPETVIAFDFGLTRIGLAAGQQVTGSAGPIGVAANGADGPDWRHIDALVTEWQPSRLIVGLPLHADGTLSELSARAEAFAAELRRYSLPVEMVDERYSSLEARKRLVEARQSGLSRRLRRDRVDAAAAVLIAERWLDRAGAGPLPGAR